MPRTQPKSKPQPKKKLPLISILVLVLVGGVLLAGAGFAFAAVQESNDPFCASCHSQPETTFYQRSTGAQPVDLASFHTTKQTHCIDCHSGTGVTGRVQAELMGARNALLWISGTAQQPAPLTQKISQDNCLKCHQNVTARGFTPKEQITLPTTSNRGRNGSGRANHWHEFLARWQANSPTAGTCTSCHDGHVTGGTAQSGFLVAQNVQATCNACHQVLRED